MKKRTVAAGVFVLVAVALGAGELRWGEELRDPVSVCKQRSMDEFERLEALAAPIEGHRVGEVARDLECWGGEPKAAVFVSLPRAEVTPREALALLGEGWQVAPDRWSATTVDGTWAASASRTAHEGVRLTSVVIHRG